MLDWKDIRQKASRVTRWLILGLPFILPAYVIRIMIGPVPTTFLELYLFSLLTLFTIAYGRSGWRRAGALIGAWRAPILFFVLVSFASVFWSPHVFAGLGLWRAYILEPLLLFFVLPIVLDTKTNIHLFLRNLYLTVIGISIWALWQFVTGTGIPHPWNVAITDGRRATGPFPFPNAVALFVVPIAALAAARFSKEKTWLAGLTVLASFGAILLAQSDGGLIALTVAVLFVLFLSDWGRKWAIAMILAGALIFLTQPSVRAPLVKEVTFQGWSGNVRLYIWRETWTMLQDRPLLGAGFGGYPTVFAAYHKATAIEIFQYPHNILFNFWSEMGILGVLAFLWLLVTWLWRASRTSRVTVMAVLLALCIHGLVDVPYFKNDLAIIFWLLIFLSMRLGIDAKKGRR